MMQLIDISDKNLNDVLSELHEEIKKEIVVVNISIFFSRIDEKHHAIVSFYE